MSYFRAMPNALLAQREDLEAVYQALCRDISEIGGIIRQLQTMTSFDGPVEALRRAQRRGGEQQVKLRQCARVLGDAAGLYIQTELRNLDDGAPAIRAVPFTPYPKYPPITWELREMLPGAEALLGAGVVIPEID